MANEPKLHHYLPRDYLKRWLDQSESLWVFDRRKQEIRRQRPEVSGADHEMYTLDFGAQRFREAETFLAETVDGPGLAAIKALEQSGPSESTDWTAIARFAASFVLRTPAFRKSILDTDEQLRDRLVKDGLMRAPLATATLHT